MKSNWFLILCSGIFLSHTALGLEPNAFVKTYCVECHGADKQKADRRFDDLAQDFMNLKTLEAWQEVLDQLNLGEMPPSKAKQPSPEETKEIVAWITKKIDAAQAELSADLAKPVVRRLNREQYNNTVRTLLHLKPMLADPTESFPPDIAVDHFETVGSALVTSDFLMESYLDTAEALIQTATNESPKPPKSEKWTFKAPFSKLPARPDGMDKVGEYQHIRKNPTYEDGYLWLSKFQQGVPHSGYYELTFKAAGIHRNYPYDEKRVGVNKDEALRIGVVAGNQEYGDLKAANGSDRHLFEEDLPDGKPKTFSRRIWLDQGYQPRFTFPNGPNRTKPLRSYTVSEFPEGFHDFIQFIKPGDNEFRNLPKEFQRGGSKSKHPITGKSTKALDATKFYTNKNSNEGWIAWTKDFKGPRVRVYEVTLEGPFFEEWPTKSHFALYGDYEITMENASKILHRFATAAFRRPPSKEEMTVLNQLSKNHHQTGHTALESIQLGLQAILCSPSFLYLPKGDDDPAIASKLSYFLWSDTPDYQLRTLAKEGKLSDPVELKKHVARLVKDPRSRAFVDAFTNGWLHLEKVGTQPPSHTKYPTYFTNDLENAMIEETRLFFEYLLKENLPITHFIASDFTFLNANLAGHYGIDNVRGNHFRKVQIFDRRRGGLLGQASVLTASANGIDTSPVIRGIWVLENILGDPPNPPPPDIEPIEPDIRGVTTIREQLHKHREVETCAECHEKIDPIGFALENFDPIGGWRIRYMDTAKKPMIDASGNFPDGTGFRDMVELKSHLLDRKEQFARCLTEKLLVYASGRTLTVTDRPHIDRILRDLEAKGWGMQDLILLVAQSEIFKS